MMSNVAEGFDVWLAQWHGDVLRLCLALSLNRRAARELTFQAFLRLGACDAADDAQARRTVMTAAVDVCEAYYFRKMRRHPGAKALWEALDTPADDALLPLLRLPFRRRAAVCGRGDLLLGGGGAPREPRGARHRGGGAQAEERAAGQALAVRALRHVNPLSP